MSRQTNLDLVLGEAGCVCLGPGTGNESVLSHCDIVTLSLCVTLSHSHFLSMWHCPSIIGPLPRVSTEDFRVVSVFETLILLASSLEYPERIRVDSVVEMFVCLSVCLFFVCLLVCLQIFSFFPLSSFSFYTVQYRRVQYSTVIGQLPRVSTEDRVVSVFETSVCSLFFVLCQQIFSFFPLSSFSFYKVQYRRVQYSTI